MTLQDIWTWWNRFWFERRSTLPVCIFRILLGLLILEEEFLKLPDWLAFYGSHGIYSMDTCQEYLGAWCINLLTFLPQTDTVLIGYLVVFLLAVVCFTLGLFTRTSTFITYLMLATIHHRNPLILNGGDTLIRCFMFWMLFVPSGELLSVDRWLKQLRGVPLDADPQRSMWGWRLLQLQLLAAYCQCFCSKLFGDTWLAGTAVYYVLHEKEYLRFPLPLNINNILLSKCLTYGTLVVEFSLWTLIWVKEFRYYILGAGLLFHLGLEYTMNLPIFEQVMMCSYILFVDPADIRRVYDWVRIHWFQRASSSKVTVARSTSAL